MCLLLLYLSSQATPGQYRLIVASNRDEYFLRPAKPVHVWDENSNIIAGMDMTPGKEGGTWLASSRLGRIAVLLNFSSVSSDPNKKGRGFLASDHVVYEKPSIDHLENLKLNAAEYNPFHLVSIDLKDPSCQLRHFCNINPKITEFQDGCHAFCNSTLEHPYKKAIFGQNKIEEIVKNYGQSIEKKDELVESLIELLKNEEQHYPDSVIDNVGTISQEMRGPISAICVRSPSIQYGTRTHTVLLVDHDNNLDFYEWTLKIPFENNIHEWIKSHHKIKINL